MKSFVWTRAGLCALLIAGLGCAEARSDDWVSLFDGETLSGWTKGGGTEESRWEVKDGVIVGSGTASMLYSPKRYKNFKFRAEVKINDKGNSGLYFRSPANDGDFGKGYEAQIDSTHRDPIRTGSLYGFCHVYKQLVPPDEWFAYEVEVVDKDWRGTVMPHISIRVNGDELFTYLDRAQTWDEGYFAFQQHDPGSRVEIRKIEVIELP